MKFKKGDQIIVAAGKDKGRRGKIEKIYLKKQMVLVPGVNIYKKHLKSQGEKKPGGIVDVVKPLSLAKVALICPKCGKKTRIGYHLADKRKERICKKCQAII
jgi:large subunit ribosomal protein L24